ncbi:MAG TPA: DNA polymerase/3'-5' exonuclease PolX [Acidimicrobiales bacterium]|nr:DNA polymerase/3'-5' exonuclease PolX [Acidimicrobiales bacterium]
MPSANDMVANALRELADLLAVAGGDPYRVRAYEKAARSVAGYPLDVGRLDARALEQIPAVGEHIAAKIAELLATGRLAELEELRAQLPAGLRSLLEVPGLGPRRAHQVYEELHVASVPELLEALRRRRLRQLRGWGPASEERLAAALARHEEMGGRLQLGSALELAEELLDAVRAIPAVERAEVAGSLRRRCETIGDIDLLAASHEPEAVMEAFARLPSVAQVPARGPTKAVARTASGVHVDLRVVAPGSWGAALVYFTGSKAHGIHLRRLARRRGMKLSEYALERRDATVVAAATEEEVYEALGLAWVPPVLREDRGEVDAAQARRLPHLVQLGDLRGDLHTHTTLTDGLATLEELVAAARRHGYRYLAVTDHAPALRMQRMTADKALAQRAALRALERDDGIALLHGSELNIQADGSLDFDDEFLAGFDILVASVHSAFELGREAMTRRLIRAIEHPAVNVIGHPTSRSIGRRPPIDFDAEAVFAAAARSGTALEINSFPDRLDLPDELARLARERGVMLAISSDAHALRHLDNLRYGVATAQRGWVEPEQVINTWPLERLRAFLAKGRRLSTAR